jgi:hypothetical protein
MSGIFEETKFMPGNVAFSIDQFGRCWKRRGECLVSGFWAVGLALRELMEIWIPNDQGRTQTWMDITYIHTLYTHTDIINADIMYIYRYRYRYRYPKVLYGCLPEMENRARSGNCRGPVPQWSPWRRGPKNRWNQHHLEDWNRDFCGENVGFI